MKGRVTYSMNENVIAAVDKLAKKETRYSSPMAEILIKEALAARKIKVK